MTADDLAVGVLSLAGVRPAAVQGASRSCSWSAARRSSTSLPGNSRPPPGPRGQGAPRRPGDDRAAAEASRSLGGGGHELLPSPGGGAAPARARGPGDRAPRRGRISRPFTAWPSSRRGRGWAWPPPTSRPPTTWSTRSPTPGCRTSHWSGACPAEGAASGAPGAARRRHRLLHRGGRAGAAARGLRRAGDHRRPGTRSAGDRDARGPPGAARRPQAGRPSRVPSRGSRVVGPFRAPRPASHEEDRGSTS